MNKLLGYLPYDHKSLIMRLTNPDDKAMVMIIIFRCYVYYIGV